MNKIEEIINTRLMPIAIKFQNNKYMSAISDGFSMILPITMLGAIFTLLSSMQFELYQNFLKITHLATILSYASKVTTDMIALYVVCAIAYNLTIKLGFEKDAFFSALLSLVLFFILLPSGMEHQLESGEVITIPNALSTEYLGAKGMFMGIILGMIIPIIYCAIIKRGIVIKMPASVPPTIAKSFAAIAPAFILTGIFSLIRFGFEMTSYGDANNFIYTILGCPLQNLGNSPISFILLIVFAQLLWFFGIHGYMIIRPILQTVFIPLSLMNLAAFEAGEQLPNAITYQHYGTYANLGGSGALLGLALLMSFTAKSDRYKKLGRMALPATFFGINEPVIFGVPMVLNTIFFIPFLIGPILMFVIPYLLQVFQIIETLRGIQLPLGTPALVYGWLEGGTPVLIVQAVLIVIQVVIWLPFFKAADRQAILEEAQLAEEIRKEKNEAGESVEHI
ncbi:MULTISPECIES: PTS sugar transporter subunit IIC [unclassified Enterococcus]|uniref:PTS sugar transporter subunit IIC n=1 Tax=unclassified Enterococcus TaxID=2608891 RepID=UPI001CE1E0FE|nr:MULTISPECIES: PTS transporter subunit EIIC [unclassified Enterococcus]MCA5012068.1 PTS sugar transporter subunit IIC [Enterococcus sp. S23]MCA5015319.1 PTS sugar transporter subunit IIC [Enterococcus sp. S22(2020)]